MAKKKEILGCTDKSKCEKSKYIDAIHELGKALKKLKIPFEYFYPGGKFGDIILPWCKGMIRCNSQTWGDGRYPFKLEGRKLTELNESIQWFVTQECAIKTTKEAYKRVNDEWTGIKQFLSDLQTFANKPKTFKNMQGDYSLNAVITAYYKDRSDRIYNKNRGK